MEYKTEHYSEADSDTNSDTNQHEKKRQKTSHVWTFFRPLLINGKELNECIICHAHVGKQTSNLSRHLITTHSITKPTSKGFEEKSARLRTSRSFVWKYSTKEDLNHARCHFCNKVLYCGGGNTSNLSKHLRRRHMDLIDERTDDGEEVAQATSTIMDDEFIEEGLEGEEIGNNVYKVYSMDGKSSEGVNTKDKKGSYVWNFCDKLSRHTIRCKLCSKVMSFHGTANVITHLQRRHNIVGPVIKYEENSKDNEFSEDVGNNLLIRRRSVGTASVVWKYCKRISRDVVRCSFCKKNLSYQGTSNLQRHLHRMHGIVTQGRALRTGAALPKENEELKFTEDFLLEYFEEYDNGTKTKCKMCDFALEGKDLEAISTHLVTEHALRPPQPIPKPPKKIRTRADYSSAYSDDDNSNWSNFDEGSQHTEEMNEVVIKKDETYFDDIIEEVDEGHANYDEEPIDTNMVITNPLSPRSTQSCAGDMSPDPKSRGHALCSFRNNPKLQKLNEERIRMETEYFREKAAFFRMQKYLVALQAKKARIELEQRVNNTTLEYPGPTYTVNVDIPQDELHILPTQ